MTDNKQPKQPKPSTLMEQLEQEHMLAQVISSMPSNMDNGPDVTIAAPIRAKWAHRLYQQGVRVFPDKATHKIVNHGSGFTGEHGPRSFQKIDQDALMAMLQKMNPDLYKRVAAARDDRHGAVSYERMLQDIAERLPQELIEKLAPKVDSFAEENIPDDSPYGKP